MAINAIGSAIPTMLFSVRPLLDMAKTRWNLNMMFPFLPPLLTSAWRRKTCYADGMRTKMARMAPTHVGAKQ